MIRLWDILKNEIPKENRFALLLDDITTQLGKEVFDCHIEFVDEKSLLELKQKVGDVIARSIRPFRNARQDPLLRSYGDFDWLDFAFQTARILEEEIAHREKIKHSIYSKIDELKNILCSTGNKFDTKPFDTKPLYKPQSSQPNRIHPSANSGSKSKKTKLTSRVSETKLSSEEILVALQSLWYKRPESGFGKLRKCIDSLPETSYLQLIAALEKMKLGWLKATNLKNTPYQSLKFDGSNHWRIIIGEDNTIIDILHDDKQYRKYLNS